MHASTVALISEKSFTLGFMKQNASVEVDSEKWQWQPVRCRGSLDLQTATFSGKNQADDYTNE